MSVPGTGHRPPTTPEKRVDKSYDDGMTNTRSRRGISLNTIKIILTVALCIFFLRQDEEIRLDPPARMQSKAPTPFETEAVTRTFYHRAREDRSGAVIQDMLLAHAFAFSTNQRYGGACPPTTNFVHLPAHLEMIQTLGLSHVLQFSCPNSSDYEFQDVVYQKRGARLWTNEWLRHIRAQQTPSIQSSETVVAHIRRGDVTICEESVRYLPNSHYLALLDDYCTGASCHVYSEHTSVEPWTDFGSRYQLHLDESPAATWRAMMSAKVLILSKSSFSTVPALFNPNTVVYTPFWIPPLPHWTVVRDDVARRAQRAVLRLRATLCHH